MPIQNSKLVLMNGIHIVNKLNPFRPIKISSIKISYYRICPINLRAHKTIISSLQPIQKAPNSNDVNIVLFPLFLMLNTRLTFNNLMTELELCPKCKSPYWNRSREDKK